MNYDFISKDESIIMEGKVNKTIFLGFNVGGDLILTNKRLIFKKLFSSKIDEIPLNTITFIGDAFNVLIPSKNMIKIHTKNGDEYQFLVVGKQKEQWKQNVNVLVNQGDLNQQSSEDNENILNNSTSLDKDNQEMLNNQSSKIELLKNKKVAIIGIVVIIVAIVCIISATPKYKQAEIDFYNAMSNLDAKELYSLLPDAYIDYIQDNYDMRKKDVIESIELFFEEMDLNDVDIKSNKNKLTFLSSKEVDANAIYNDNDYFVLNNIDLDISQAMFLELKVVNEDTDYSIKIDGEWYSANNIVLVESSIMYKSLYDVSEDLNDISDSLDDWDWNSDSDYNDYDDYDSTVDNDYDFDWDY